MSDATQAVYARIQKLLALAETRGATEAEAALAAEHVQRLLQEHNLTLSQVEATTNLTASTREKKEMLDRRAMYAYQRELMVALAQNNFCLHRISAIWRAHASYGAGDYRMVDGVRTRGYTTKVHLLVGRSLNIQVTVDTYDYLIEAVHRANQFDHRTRDGKLFLSGAVSRLAERLAERRREAERASRLAAPTNGTGRELVLSDVYGTEADLNNDALNGFPQGTTAAKRRGNADRAAKQQAEHDRLVAEGVDSDIAWYRAYGYSEEAAQRHAASWRKGRGGRSRRGFSTNDAHYRKVRSGAYQAGRAAGETIGLDTQVGGGRAARQITGGK
jgi:hypothetical protein